MNQPVPVILAGLGGWATNRTVIPACEGSQPLLRPLAVVSLEHGEDEYITNVEPVFRAAGLQPPRYFETLEEAARDPEISQLHPSAAIINTPNKFHVDNATTALDLGLHVYIERPPACPNDDLEELLKAAERRNRLLYTGMQRRMEATYSYVRDAVSNQREFGRLSSIRCCLAAAERLKGWRRKRDIAGGGIILDSGYHLLDAAVWVAESAGVTVPDDLVGAVVMKIEDACSSDATPLDVETTAVGHVVLAGGVILSFDFSYNVPSKSIYERFEVRDEAGSRIVLTRNQSVRSPEPARVTHQRADGSCACAYTGSEFGVRLDDVSLSGVANNTGPLRSFCEAIANGGCATNGSAVCDAREAVSTWRLVRGIYRLASSSSKGASV